MVEDYVFNKEWNVLAGEQYVKNGLCEFPDQWEGRSNDADKVYRTCWNGASHKFKIITNSNRAAHFATRRLLGKRLVKGPDGEYIYGYHERLQNDQRKFIKKNKDFVTMLADKYRHHFFEYTNSKDEAILHCSDPHPKREIREEALEELYTSGKLHDENDMWMKSLWWKLKKDEWCKEGKKPRMIGDLGVAASLRGFVLTGLLKQAQFDEPIHYKNGTMVFCKSPDPVVLEEIFEQLINPRGDYFFAYFSDDSCLSIRNKMTGEVDYYNLDISSCDSSHTEALFATLVNLVPENCKKDMRILVKQCAACYRVVDVNNKKRVILYKPKGPKLPSGSTVTTAINNIANILICKSIVDGEYLGPASIEAAAAKVGYVVTGCNPLKKPEQLQFLKNSPVMDTSGRYRSMLNLGVLLRAYGCCRGDLPGSGDFDERAKAFNRGIIQGAYPYCNSSIKDKIRETLGVGPVFESKEFEYKVTLNENATSFRATDESIMARYGLNQVEFDDLLEFASCGIHEFVNNAGVSKVLNLDYGGCTTHNDGYFIME